MICEGELEPGLFSSITLVDVTPRLNREGVNHIFDFMRHRMDDGFADLGEAADMIAEFTGRPRKDDLSGLEKNLRRRDGRYYWHWDPRFMAGARRGNPEYEARIRKAAQQIRVPTLLVRGGASDVVSEEGARDFLKLVPHGEYVDVTGAGHMVAGDKNDHFTDAVQDFLSRTFNR